MFWLQFWPGQFVMEAPLPIPRSPHVYLLHLRNTIDLFVKWAPASVYSLSPLPITGWTNYLFPYTFNKCSHGYL